MTSNVPRTFHGSCWSMPTSVVHTCGHLKSETIAFKSKDWASCEPFFVGIGGFGGARFGFAPGLEMTLPIHTKGTRPVKTPVPPLICVVRAPAAFIALNCFWFGPGAVAFRKSSTVGKVLPKNGLGSMNWNKPWRKMLNE